ncbi:MAG TPA: hypothetical protein DDW52_12075, partial [Planctomycetaceae bacterium]|nr:hypothetical protein [Planctomycetaceae bacterium]
AFGWLDEIWTARSDGSELQRLTNHRARDSRPLFSPDGKQIAFVSNRSGTSQLYVMPASGGMPKQVTFHSEGYTLQDWYPDGKALLATGRRDHYHRDADRLLKVHLDARRADTVLADAMAEDAKLSSDGGRVLFTREGERWWRKGYEGERSAQVWMLEFESGKFTELLHEGVECMWPQWMAGDKGFLYTKGHPHGFDLWQYRFPKEEGGTPKQKRVAGFDDDSIAFPSISRDGKTIIFRHLFDLYTMRVGKGEPQKVELVLSDDAQIPSDEQRRELPNASEVAFTNDGLEIAFITGGDVWVMDTKLREPKRITETPGYEKDLLFSADRQSLWFTSNTNGKVDVHMATRKDDELYWWQCDEFNVEPVTDDAHVESNLSFTPDGEHLVFQQGRGDLVVMDLESKTKREIASGFSGISYDVSPDSRWITYSQQDDDFNSEIWITDIAGERKPVNVSRHPDNDYSPRFSPDGKILAFTGRRMDEEVDIYYVYLSEADDQETSRDRRVEEALELMKKKRKSAAKKPKEADADSKESSASTKEGDGKKESSKDQAKETSEDLVKIDFENIHERVKRIFVPNSFESGLLFSPDGKKLAFSASIDGKRGWYTVTFPDELRSPKLLTSSTGSNAVWSKEAGAILMNRGGTPTRLETSGKLESYSFEVAQSQSRSEWLRTGFEEAWLVMREVWYDPRYANKNWDEIRRKYSGAAAMMHDTAGLAKVVELMLGELNGSHLGFYPSGGGFRSNVEGWTDVTAHLGVRFNEDFNGPGLLVRDVIPNGPADKANAALSAGDVILQIDSTPVDPAMDLTEVLNGRLDREIELTVKTTGDDDAEDEEKTIAIRPISYSAARGLLYPKWIDDNRDAVDKLSKGKLGYLHIRAMSMSSFYDFERELYNVGYGREGIVIDVRDNGGGSTTDRLLTSLTQPRHAITVPRGGGQGYPHDRSVYAYWNKPIIVLCNQNSYSNAEIFSHAIKGLGRGKVVGVRTAGGVVSTGSATVIDVGRIRVPFRGWFVLGTGEDMERNGCEPNVTIWPEPGELPQGIDRQLEKAVQMLVDEVGAGRRDADLIYASERDMSTDE